LAPLIAAGAKVAFFMPMLHLPFRGRTNLRNHRKIVVVDGRHALTGGMNLAEDYMGPTPDPKRWRDFSLVISGPAVTDLVDLFHSDWKFATGEDIRKEDGLPFHIEPKGSIAQVVASGPDVSGDPLYESLVSVAFAAQWRIWVVTPYFVPDETLVRALELAARRGVDVRVVVPARSNHLMADLARVSYLRQVQKAGGEVLMYEPGMVRQGRFDRPRPGHRRLGQYGYAESLLELRGGRVPLFSAPGRFHGDLDRGPHDSK